MRRKYLGPIAGVVLSLAVAGMVVAGTSSARWNNATPGTNTSMWTNINHTTFNVWSCANHNSDLNAYFDWMHHWPVLPATGTLQVTYPCNVSGTYTYTWTAGSRADYSVEYTHYNNSNVSTNWSASY